MDHHEPWQVYSQNGNPIKGQFASRQQFSEDANLIMGASHVWIWRLHNGAVEILLQKRSMSKKTWPGFYDVSAAGHIDGGESAVEAAVREAKEEINVDIDSLKLHYVFALRTPLNEREFDTVFLYRLDESVEFVFNDGEVEALLWKGLDEFDFMTKNIETSGLVPQGKAYFLLLLDSLRLISS